MITALWSNRMRHYPRHMDVRLSETLDSARVVVLHGARQSGKTTLAQALASDRGGTYVTLDDDQVLDTALADPHTFVRAYPYPLVIDEIQLGGERLVRALKIAVDNEPIRGRYVVTGSTNFLTVPTISESLAGRAAILQLSPLSQAELAGIALDVRAGEVPGVIGSWFESRFRTATRSDTSRDGYLDKVCTGGYPEVIDLAPHSRIRWFEDYTDTVLSRDIVALGDIRRSSLLSRLLRLAAASTAREINIAKWAQRLGADRATVESYLGWLRTVFLVQYIPSWTRNRAARVIRRPKLHLTDSGLAAALIGIDAHALRPPTATGTGPLLETFVTTEIARQLGAGIRRVMLYHYRDRAGREVDLVLERSDSAVVAIEVKATASPRGADLRHIAALRDRLDTTEPGAFRAGILLHMGTNSLSFGDRLHSAPIEALWRNYRPQQV